MVNDLDILKRGRRKYYLFVVAILVLGSHGQSATQKGELPGFPAELWPRARLTEPQLS